MSEPEASEIKRDPGMIWAEGCLRLIARVRRYGMEKALGLEMDTPSMTEPTLLPAWSRMILNLKNPDSTPMKIGANLGERGGRAYSCHTCRDTLFTINVDDGGVAWSRRCTDCTAGLAAAQAEVSKAAGFEDPPLEAYEDDPWAPPPERRL